MDYDSLERICAEAAGLIDCDGYYDPHAASWRLVGGTVNALLLSKPTWEKPAKTKSEVEGIRDDILALVRRIERLDNHTRWRARTASFWKEQDRLSKDWFDADQSNDPKLAAKAENELRAHIDVGVITPLSECVDYALIQKLLDFEVALRDPAEAVEAAVDRGPKGRGRRRNEWAYRVALIAARFFEEATGARPTSWTGGETPFSRFVASLYREMGIEADLRKPIEWAMSELEKKS